MRLVRDIFSCPDGCRDTVLGLGNFDGVHRGHQAILKHCADIARTEGKKAAAMTFTPHPREFFTPGHAPLRIYPLRRKLELLDECGIDIVFLARFNKRLAATSAASFVEDILHKNLNVHHVVTGYNFAFGKGRLGDTAFLSAQAQKLGLGFTAITRVEQGGTVISSSAIREALAAGEMEKASLLLGRPYEIAGRVRHGDSRGRGLGFPTANMGLSQLFKPRFGVYAARVFFEGEKRWHDAVINIGIRPMFPGAEPLLEAHCFGMNRMVYGERMRVRPLAFLRSEAVFDGIETLKIHMEQDCRQAKEFLDAHP